MPDSAADEVGPQELVLDGLPRVVGQARRFAVDAAAARGADEDALDTVRTLVSELVTNVVLHAATSLVLVVDDDGECVRVTVHDGNPAAPLRRRPGATSTTGRGMRLLAVLPASSGVGESDRVAAGGKAVWFSVPKATSDEARAAVAAAAWGAFGLEGTA